MKKKDITGHLTEKNGYYYMIINLWDANGKSKPKWIATGLKVKGNKTQATAMLQQTIREQREKANSIPSNSENTLFSDYMKNWLEQIENAESLAATTISGYRANITRVLVPYFEPLGVTVQELTVKHLDDFYKHLMTVRGVKGQTVKRYHANIRKALQHAFAIEEIVQNNVADKAQLPKPQDFIHSELTVDELNELFEKISGDRIELGVLITAFYGFRRSETIGLKWNAIDFKNNKIMVRHIVTEAVDKNGKTVLVQADRGKSASSVRTLPLMPKIAKLLRAELANQKMYQEICGREYTDKFKGYIFVDELGYILKPNLFTTRFKVLLERNNLPIIRFHDLRHSCVTLLIDAGVPMKDIQKWLGHSSIVTTDKFYGKYDTKRHEVSAGKVNDLLNPKTNDLEEGSVVTDNNEEIKE